MRSEIVVSIWGGNFNSEKELIEYSSFSYETDPDGDCELCRDLEISHLSEDLVTAIFLTVDRFDKEIDNIPFINSFKDELLSVLGPTLLSTRNSLILIYGIKNEYGVLNENIFNFIPKTNYEKLEFKKKIEFKL